MTERTVQRSYKIRFYPTAKQRQMLQQCFGAARWVWNDCLAMRSKAYRRRGDRLTGTDYSRHLTFLKTTDQYGWLNTIPSTVLTQSLRDQDRAFTNFFQGRARHPRFKNRSHNQSIRFQLDQVKNRRLARHLSDAAIAELYRMLAYKCRWHGRTLLTVDRWYPSSKTCSDCGYVHSELSDRQWSCGGGGCGSRHDRDHNATINILHEGLNQLVPGGIGESTRVESDITLPRPAVGAGAHADDEARTRQPAKTYQE